MSENKEIWTILHELRHSITNSRHSLLSFPKKSIVDSLLEHLQNECEDIQYECLLLLSAAIPKLGDDLDKLMANAIPQVLKHLGRKDLQVKLATMNLIYAYLKNTDDIPKFMKQFIKHSLGNVDVEIQRGGLVCANILLKLLLKEDSIILLLESVAKMINTSCLHHLYSIFYTLRKIQLMIGDKKFFSLLNSSKTNGYQIYMNLQSGKRPSSNMFPINYDVLKQVLLEQVSMEDELKRCEIMHSMWSRIQTIGWTITDLLPHMDHFVNFLSRLCSDSSLKIRMLSLNILEVLIERTDCEIVLHLEIFMGCLVKSLASGERKIQKKSIQLIHRLMHYVHPMSVIQQLLENVHGRNSSLRIEIINRVTAGLFYCSLYSFDLDYLCLYVTPFLEDSVLQVRQATVECLVTLGYVMLMNGQPLIGFGDYLKKACHISKNSLKVIISRARKGWLPSCSGDGHIWNVSCHPPESDSTFGNASDDSCFTSRASTADSRYRNLHKSVFNASKSAFCDALNVQEYSADISLIPPKHQIETNKSTCINEKATCGVINNVETEEVVELTQSQLFSHKYVTPVYVPMKKNEVIHEYASSFSEANSDVFTPQIPGPKYDSNQYAASIASSTHLENQLNGTPRRKNMSTSTPEGSVTIEKDFNDEISPVTANDAIKTCNNDDQSTPTHAETESSLWCGSSSGGPTISEFSYVATAKDFNAIENQVEFPNSARKSCITAENGSANELTSITLYPDDEQFDIKACKNQITNVDIFHPSPKHRNFNILSVTHRPSKTDDLEELSGISRPSTPDNMRISLPSSEISVNRNISIKPEDIFNSLSDYTDDNDITITEEFGEEMDNDSLRYGPSFTNTRHEEIKVFASQEEIEAEDTPITAMFPQGNAQSLSCKEMEAHLRSTEEVLSNITLHDSRSSTSQHPRKVTYTLKKDNKPSKLKSKKKHKLKIGSKFHPEHVAEISHTSDTCKLSNKPSLKPSPQSKRSTSKNKLFNHTVHQRYRSRKMLKHWRNDAEKKSPKLFENWLKKNFFLSENNISVRRSNWLTNALEKSLKAVIESTFKHNEQEKKVLSSQTQIMKEVSDIDTHVKPACQSITNIKPAEKSIETLITPKRISPRKPMTRVGHNKSKSLTSTITDEDGVTTFEKMISDVQSEIKPFPERRASEQWSSNIDFPLRCRTCHWADSFEEKIKNQEPFERLDLAQIALKQACEAISDSDLPRKDGSVTQKDEYVAKKEETMLAIIRIAQFNPELLEEYQMNKIIINLLTETKNLRASIAGQAVLTIGYLFMLKPLESKLRVVLAALLGKSGNRTFAGSYNAVIKSIFYLLKGVPLQKSVMAMILEGAKHPNKAVRETAAQFLLLLTQKLGPNRSLASNLAVPMLNTAAQFVMDGSPLTRHCGKLMFSTFMDHKNFEALKKKHISDQIQLSISKILQAVTTKGVEKDTLPIDVIWREEF